MKLHNKKLEYPKDWILPDIYLFSSNSVVKKDGSLVMGAGAAKHVNELCPSVAGRLGPLVSASKSAGIEYGVILTLVSITKAGSLIGAFQVKDHYRDRASLDLIKNSTKHLREIALLNEFLRFHLNFPGIGHGGLSESEVLPILETLPDNVNIYKMD